MYSYSYENTKKSAVYFIICIYLYVRDDSYIRILAKKTSIILKEYS